MTWTIVRSCNFLIFFSVRLCEGSNYLCFPLMSDILMTQSAVVLSQSTVRNYLKGLIDFSGCPPPQQGALGAGYDVPGWRARRLVFNMTVKLQNPCLSSDLIPGQMDMKRVLISAAKQVIVLAGHKNWPTTCATSKPGVIIRMEIKIGFTGCLAQQVFSHLFSSCFKRACNVLNRCKFIS